MAAATMSTLNNRRTKCAVCKVSNAQIEKWNMKMLRINVGWLRIDERKFYRCADCGRMVCEVCREPTGETARCTRCVANKRQDSFEFPERAPSVKGA